MDYFLDNYCHTVEFCNENCNDYILDVQSTLIVYFILFLMFYWTVELYFNKKEPIKVEFLIKVKDSEYDADEESDEESDKELEYESNEELNKKKIKIWVRKNNRLCKQSVALV